jgi:Meckel syndrome type 1 protein
MRAMMAGLLGLCVCLGTAVTAEARSDSRATAQSQASRGAPAVRPSASAPRPAASAPRGTAAARPVAARPVAARPTDARQATLRPAVYRTTTTVPDRSARGRAQAAVPYSGRPAATTAARRPAVAAASCTTSRQGRRVCTSRDASLRWTGGLAPAALSQASCPDGTMATNAIGHRDVVRCVPL